MLIELKNADINIAEKHLLGEVNFHVEEGEFIYIIGAVGSGKSSLLKMLYGELPVNKYDSVFVFGKDIKTMKRKHLPAFRKQLGIIFQDFQLLSDRTVGENLNFVLRATGWKKDERKQRIQEVLETVELSDRIDHYPHQLSGGEQQRVSIARALLNRPKIILADEPTGNLDSDTSFKIVGLLKQVCEQGTAVVMITHNPNLLQQFPGIVYRCEDGSMKDVTAEYNSPIDIEA